MRVDNRLELKGNNLLKTPILDCNAGRKTLTEEYARDISGVKNVQNEMTGKAPAGSPQTLGEKIDDASVTAQIKATLLWHRATNLRNIKVETKDSVVTLTGVVQNTS